MPIPRCDGIAILLITGSLAISTAACQLPRPTAAEHAPICEEQKWDPAAQAALRLVCRDAPGLHLDSSPTNTIIVGFVGGYADPKDEKHPEVLFAEYLREHYAAAIHARVFANHDQAGALRFVIDALHANAAAAVDPSLGPRIILYGHSWGASEAIAFAGELGRRGIPVQLTIQMDIVAKPGQNPVLIPDNVHDAVNFYQIRGVLHGRPTIRASAPDRTEVIGNFLKTYRGSAPDCNNYPWFVRTFNKPHHEIENDPEVWRTAALLVAAEISRSQAAQAMEIPDDSLNSLPSNEPASTSG